MHKGHDCVAKIKPVNLKIVYNTITSMKIEPFKNCNTVYTQSMYDIVIFNATYSSRNSISLHHAMY